MENLKEPLHVMQHAINTAGYIEFEMESEYQFKNIIFW